MFLKNGNRYSVPYLNQRLAYFCQFLYNNLTILIWPLWRAYTKLKIKSSYQLSLVKFNFLNWAFFCMQDKYIFIWFSRKLWINIRKSLIPLRSPEIISTPICPIRYRICQQQNSKWSHANGWQCQLDTLNDGIKSYPFGLEQEYPWLWRIFTESHGPRTKGNFCHFLRIAYNCL